MKSRSHIRGRTLFESLRTALRDHAESLILAVLLALVVRWFVVSAYIIRSEDMAPTLRGGDIVLGFRPPFGLQFPGFGEMSLSGRLPHRGELVVFRCPRREGLCLRRVIALPGDRLEMAHQRLTLNGVPCQYAARDGFEGFKESCPQFDHQILFTADWKDENWGPIICPPGHVLVLNDFRPNQNDSRSWGPVPLRDLEASIFAHWLSLDWSASSSFPSVRWHRSFSRVD